MGLTKASNTIVGNTFSEHFKFLGSSGLVGTWAAGPFSTDLNTKALIPNTDLTFVDDLAGQKVVIDYDTTTPVLKVDSIGDNLFLIAEVTTASGEITAVADKRTPAIQRSLVSEDLAGMEFVEDSFGGLVGSYTSFSANNLSAGGLDGNGAIIFTLCESTKNSDRFITSFKIDGGTELLGTAYEVIDRITTGFTNNSNMRVRTWYIPESSGELGGNHDIELLFSGSITNAFATCYTKVVAARQGNTPSSYLRFVEDNSPYNGDSTRECVVVGGDISPDAWSTGGGLASNESLWLTGHEASVGGGDPTGRGAWTAFPLNTERDNRDIAVGKVARIDQLFWTADSRSSEITGDDILFNMTASAVPIWCYGFVIPPALI